MVMKKNRCYRTLLEKPQSVNSCSFSCNGDLVDLVVHLYSVITAWVVVTWDVHTSIRLCRTFVMLNVLRISISSRNPSPSHASAHIKMNTNPCAVRALLVTLWKSILSDLLSRASVELIDKPSETAFHSGTEAGEMKMYYIFSSGAMT